MPVDATAAGAAVLEIERFDFVTPDRIEIAGHWTGLRGRRFMRPTLVLKGEGNPRRLLALLEHKPWTASEGEEWVAAFAWDGEVVKFESAELNVGSGIDLKLPPPRMRPGKPRRFKQRVAVHDASRGADTTTRTPSGLVSDAPRRTADEPKLSRAEALKRAKEAAVPSSKAKPASKESAGPAASKESVRPETAKGTAGPRAAKDPVETVAATEPAEPVAATEPAEPVAATEPVGPDETLALEAPVAADPPRADVPAAPDASGTLRVDLDAARADAERIRGERETFRRERDQALEKLRGVRAELEQERQAREKAVADARAEERESSSKILHDGAELRASVERQREIAYLERDDAKKARDEAVAARDKACEERDAALAEAKDARHERKEAFAQRDRATKLRDRAEADRTEALNERDSAFGERDEAVRERDEILRAHERGLPVHPPKPRFLPERRQQRSDFDVWGPRASALAVLFLCALIVLRLFACG